MEDKFIRPEHRKIVLSGENPVELIEQLTRFEQNLERSPHLESLIYIVSL